MYRSAFPILLALALLLPHGQCRAEADPDGLAINQTVTRFGQDFYNSFVKYWNEYQLVMPTNLTVYERPTARFGSLIWIEYRGQRIFQQYVGPSMRAIDELAKAAAANIFTYLLNEQNALNGGSNNELEGTENF